MVLDHQGEESLLNEESNSTAQIVKTATEERDLIQSTQETYGQELGEVGEIWYVLSAKWWRAWKAYTGYSPFNTATGTGMGLTSYQNSEGPRPGPITNEEILETTALAEGEPPIVRHTAMERYDYEVVPRQTWELLFSWYGGVAIPRKIIATATNKIVEVKYYKFSVITSTKEEDRSNAKIVYVSRNSTVGELKEAACKAVGVDPEERRFWDIMSGSKFAELKDDNVGIVEARLMNDQEVMLEDKAIMESDSTDDYYSSRSYTGRVYYASNYSNHSSSNYYTDTTSGGQPETCGVVGLSNLGNTCFMNSALQCLSNTIPLCQYFLSEAYSEEINRDNPLGTKGELVEAYAGLVKALWGGGGCVVTPRNFKFTLGRFAEQFMGYEQHDSQELIAYLLDMIHEDVNRILQKPFVEKVEATADEDDVLASKRAWDAHLKRNDSIIVDTFQGQYKSVVTCPECNKVSVTFDPFMYLTLPLPFSTERTLPVTFVPGDGTSLRKYVLKLPKSASILALKKLVAARAGCDAGDLQLCDMWDGKVYATLKDNKAIDTILDADITYAYLLPKAEVGGGSESDDIQIGPWAEELKKYFVDPSFLDDALNDDATNKERNGLLYRLKKFESRCSEVDDDEIERVAYQNRHTFKGVEDTKSLGDFTAALEGFSEWVGEKNGRVILKVLNQKPVVTSSYYSYSSSSLYTAFGDPFLTAYYPTRTTVGQFKRDLARKMLRVLARDREIEATLVSEEDAIQYALQVLNDKLDLVLFKEKSDSGQARRIFQNNEDDDTAHDIDADLLEHHIMGHRNFALRWGSTALEMFYDSQRAAEVEHDEQGQNKRKKDVLSVYDCLAQFLKMEQLEESEMWYCSQCKEHRRAWKQFFLWRTPPILVIHLKRFGSDGYGFREKLETFIDFPVEGLDFTQHCLDSSQPPAQYDLYAVSNHYGGLGGGHYTAYARNKETKKWYDFDDSSVQEVDESRVVTEAGYVLFYMRRDLSQQYTGGSESIPQNPNNSSNGSDPVLSSSDTSEDEAHQDSVVTPLNGISLEY